MQFKSILALSSLVAMVVANPTWGTTTKPAPPPYKPTTTTAKWGTKTSSAPAATSSASSPFLNQCLNFGISLLDCTQLANIAALNGNTITVGGASSTPSAPVNNAGPFINTCKNFGISVADCAQILNVAILNGNTLDISLADLTALVSALGLNLTTILGQVTGLLGGLLNIPAGVL